MPIMFNLILFEYAIILKAAHSKTQMVSRKVLRNGFSVRYRAYTTNCSHVFFFILVPIFVLKYLVKKNGKITSFQTLFLYLLAKWAVKDAKKNIKNWPPEWPP